MLNRLAVFLDETGDIPIRNSGLKLSELKNAAAFNLVELSKQPTKKGTLPKSFSHFRITPLGKQFLRLALSQSNDPSILLVEINKKLEKLLAFKDEFSQAIDEIHNSLSQLQGLELTQKTSSTHAAVHGHELSKDQSMLLRVLKDAEKNASSNDRFRNLYSTDFYVHALMKEGLSMNQAKDALLTLYEHDKLELQMGPEISRNAQGVTTRNNRTYHWAKLKD